MPIDSWLGVQEVAGSSPVTPTRTKAGFRDSDTRFCFKKYPYFTSANEMSRIGNKNQPTHPVSR